MAKLPKTSPVPAAHAAVSAAPARSPDAELGFSAIAFRRRLHAWYRDNARTLPWRGVHNPYATWLSEIMLQQTRVATVLDRYTAFLHRFPTIRDLAAADESAVLALWSGLGYYRRARLLHRGAQFVERELSGTLPRTAIELRTLPGVGEYTAAAIASIAFGQPIAVLDGNVERVLLRLLGEPEVKSPHLHGRLLHLAQLLMPSAKPSTAARNRSSNPAGDHNQAMMELGATICLPRSPRCSDCPVFDCCKTRGEHLTPRRATMLSQNIAHLLATRKRSVATEILLHRRPSTASLMPGMMELPALPHAEGREPVLRLRHAITTTNYYAQIFTESVFLKPSPETLPPPDHHHDHTPDHTADQPADHHQADQPAEPLPYTLPLDTPPTSLLHLLTAPHNTLEWVPTYRLPQLPLTGLTRKALQRLHLMTLPTVRFNLDN